MILNYQPEGRKQNSADALTSLTTAIISTVSAPSGL